MARKTTQETIGECTENESSRIRRILELILGQEVLDPADDE